MAFSTGLYYPWIDIKDEIWLKNALLYWDTIRTIVPSSISQPYSSDTARSLATEGVLVPLRVSSDMDEIDNLTVDVIHFLESYEGGEMLVSGPNEIGSYVHLHELSDEVCRLARIHPEKLPREIQRHFPLNRRPQRHSEDWLEVDGIFASFYMTLLASRLSERIGAALLTQTPASHKLALATKTDVPMAAIARYREYDARGRRRNMPRTLGQGMLVDLILENIGIDPETPIDKILNFRNKYASELGRFREEIVNLTSGIDREMPAESLRQGVFDIYNYRVAPAIEQLKKAIRGSRIKWLAESFIKVAFISAGSSSAMAHLGLSSPQAILVGAGLTMTASTILYSLEKRDSLTKNPLSYLLKVNREL